MNLLAVLCLICTSFTVTVKSQSSMTDNLSLFWNLYDAVYRGSRILHDVTEGVGAVSSAIKAIDSFLDISSEEETADPVPAELKDKSSAATKPPPVVAETCDASKGEPCPEPVAVPHPAIPKFNGCGALGFHIKDTDLPVDKMTDCCAIHDDCYSSVCRANKRDCDYKLRSCLFQVCDGRVVDRSLLKSCKAAAKLLFSGTMALSFQEYNEAQNKLQCPQKGNRKRRGRD